MRWQMAPDLIIWSYIKPSKIHKLVKSQNWRISAASFPIIYNGNSKRSKVSYTLFPLRDSSKRILKNDPVTGPKQELTDIHKSGS